MKYFAILLLMYNLLESARSETACQIVVSKRAASVAFRCTGLKTLQRLDKARMNTTEIEIYNSKIPNVHGHAFARFGATLVSLDLHESGIETVESQAFIALSRLEKLILWGNKLRFVPADWFTSLSNLRTLDLSFNYITEIEPYVYQMLPRLEDFYFDYNQLAFIYFDKFEYLISLKRVKFGKNPLSWPYRARLTWQLENQRVAYSEEWEDWGWMNIGIKSCMESGQGDLPNDSILDCLVGKLLDFTSEISPAEMRQGAGCNDDAARLVRCMRPRNSTGNTDNETIRRILENYVTILMPMTKSEGLFSTRTKT